MASIETLELWFSTPRMERYRQFEDPEAAYLWDVRLSKACLEDIAHVEVLLRNFMAARLKEDSLRRFGDPFWFDRAEEYRLNDAAQRSVSKARSRIRHDGHEPTYDRVVAGLTLDFWRFLLIRRLEASVWKALVDIRNGGTPFHPWRTREDFERHVAMVYSARNRCSHQEPVVSASAEEPLGAVDSLQESVQWVAESIDPEAARWIRENSRLAGLRSQMPDRMGAARERPAEFCDAPHEPSGEASGAPPEPTKTGEPKELDAGSRA